MSGREGNGGARRDWSRDFWQREVGCARDAAHVKFRMIAICISSGIIKTLLSVNWLEPVLCLTFLLTMNSRAPGVAGVLSGPSVCTRGLRMRASGHNIFAIETIKFHVD